MFKTLSGPWSDPYGTWGIIKSLDDSYGLYWSINEEGQLFVKGWSN